MSDIPVTGTLMQPDTLRCYLQLTKPRITTMVLLTAGIGYLLGAAGSVSVEQLIYTMLGTTLCCGGAGVLNNYLERDVDGRMNRTKNRPIPSGKIAPVDALMFGVLLVLVGTSLLVVFVNLISGFIALMTAFLYVLVYTPLKRITWLNTFVGAIPGALPPLGGWAAATGGLELGGWLLFAILFLWQHPHFYSIAWMYKEDYSRAGFKMLPCLENDGSRTIRQIHIYSCLLFLTSLLPTFLGISGWFYFFGMFLIGIYLIWSGIGLANSRSIIGAKKLLRASILYLSVFLLLVVTDKWL